MKKYHALTFSSNQPFELPTMTSYDKLVDVMLDGWNESGDNKLYRIIYKTSEDGSLKLFRWLRASDIPGAATSYDIDNTDEDSGYLYGICLSNEDKLRIDAYSKKQTERALERERPFA